MDIPQITPEATAKTGEMGQTYLATGKQVELRRWVEDAGECSEPICRGYETVGYLLSGVLELDLDGQTAEIEAGDSWLVPEGARHSYRVIKPIVAIEATSPPGRFNDRDEPA